MKIDMKKLLLLIALFVVSTVATIQAQRDSGVGRDRPRRSVPNRMGHR